ncbi:MFS transporter [Corynebacterium sp. 335C]
MLYLFQNLAWAAPSQLLLAQQILAWHPGEKEQRLALLMAVGGVASLIGHPLAGWLSDRTGGRFGRRAPWVLVGALLAAAALLALGAAPGFGALVAGWAVFQLVIAASINAAQAIPPDTVPDRQYGTVSGVMGLTYTLGVVLGTAVATLLGIGAAYAATAALLVAGVVQFLAMHPDVTAVRDARAARDDAPSAAPAPDAPAGTAGDPAVGAAGTAGPDAADAAGTRAARERAAAAGVGAYHDYWWVFAARFLVTAGNYVALFYLFYYLRDRIGVPDPDGGVLLLTGVYALCVVVTAMVSGRASDRSGNRRAYVALSSAGVAAACVLMAFATSFAVVVGAAVLLGLSWGVYMAVEQALINEVLPDADKRGRDVGVMNLAVAGPNALAPVLAAASLAWLGGYPGLYVFSAVITAVGAVIIRRVRTVP